VVVISRVIVIVIQIYLSKKIYHLQSKNN